MKKTTYIYIYGILLLFILGCDKIDQKIADAKEKFQKKNESKNESIQQIPNCPACPIPEGFNLDKVIYGFDSIDLNLLNFIQSTDKTFLYCQFTVLEFDSIADSLINIHKRADVEIIIDKLNTMDFCEVACVPKLESKYNQIFSDEIKIKIKNDIHYSYCVNYNGVFITSKSFSKQEFNDYFLYMKSPQLIEGYKNKFLSDFKN